MRAIVFGGILGGVLGGVALMAAPAAAVEGSDPITGFTLDNGLEVVVVEDPRAPAVVHMLWYRAGAADEPPGISGIAHFLEHLMFKGTDTREPGEFSAIVESLGGRDNAFTSWDFTGYFQRVAADYLGLMMELEADRMVNLAFSEAEWLPERDVILEERGQVVESRPGSLFNEQMRATLFQNHPYAVPIIGWRHEMEGLTDEHAMAFHAAHYAPNNAILIVAGAVTAEEVRALAEEHYGPIPANPDIAERVRPQEPPHLAERRLEMSDPRVAQPYVLRQILAPSRQPGDQAEAAALTVLAELLGGSQATSFLARELVLADDAVALSASAFYMPLAFDDTTFGLVVVPAEGVSLREAEDALDAALEAFLEQGIDAGQLARVQTRIRADEIFARDSAQGQARRIGMGLTSGLTLEDVRGWSDALMAVEAEDVMAAAEAILTDRRNAVTGWLTGPDDRAVPGAGGVELPMMEVTQ